MTTIACALCAIMLVKLTPRDKRICQFFLFFFIIAVVCEISKKGYFFRQFGQFSKFLSLQKCHSSLSFFCERKKSAYVKFYVQLQSIYRSQAEITQGSSSLSLFKSNNNHNGLRAAFADHNVAFTKDLLP